MSEPIRTGVAGEESRNLSTAQQRYNRRRSLRLLGSLLQPLKVPFAAAIVFVVLAQIARVAGPALIAYGIDTALPGALAGEWTPAWATALAYAGLALLGGICTAAYLRTAARVAQDALLDLRIRVFRHTQRLSVGFHEKYTSGRIVSRQTSDIDALRELLDNGLTTLVQTLLFMTFTAASLFWLDWRAGLVLGFAVIPLYLLSRWYQRNSQDAYRHTRVASARLIVQFVETMGGMRAVQAFRREPATEAAQSEVSADYREANNRALRLNGILEPATVLIGNLTLAIALAIGVTRILDGTVSVGILVATLLYTRRFFQPIQQLAMIYTSYQSATAALEKISGLLEEEPTIRDPEHPEPLGTTTTDHHGHGAGHVEFRGVSFGYTPERLVMPRFDLDIAAGTTVALVGSTGAGKSTLAKLVTRFYDPTEGQVRVDGRALTDLADADLRAAVVVVTQEAYLFSGSVRDNIALARPDASDAEVEAAARAVGAHEFIAALPEGYATDVNKRGGRVSAGQRQLISFARTFLADPAVLVLDEATSSLDIPGERLVQEGLAKLLAGRTAIIIAHRLSTVEIADRVLVMADGQIVEDGTPAELRSGEGRFAALHQAWIDSLV